MSKVSARLRAALAVHATLRAAVTVVLDAKLPRQQLADAADAIGKLAGVDAVQFLQQLGMVSLHTPLSNVGALEAMDEVNWIDLAAEIPLSDLLDRSGQR